MRTIVPVIIAFLSGFVMVISFFFNPDRAFIGRIESEVLVWVTIVGGFTLLLGVVSITRVNWHAVRSRKEGWVYNLLTLLSIFVMAILAILPASWSPLLGRAVFPRRLYHDGDDVCYAGLLYRVRRISRLSRP